MKTKQRKPYRTITYYNHGIELEAKLKEIGVEFTKLDTFGEFWGIRFDIFKPTGKGATEKMRRIDAL